MKTQPWQHISNKYNTCTIVASPVYIGSKTETIKNWDENDVTPMMFWLKLHEIYVLEVQNNKPD